MTATNSSSLRVRRTGRNRRGRGGPPVSSSETARELARRQVRVLERRRSVGWSTDVPRAARPRRSVTAANASMIRRSSAISGGRCSIGALAEVDDDELAVGNDDDVLTLVAVARRTRAVRSSRPQPPVAAVVEARRRRRWPVRSRAWSTQPSGRSRAPSTHAVVEVQLAEPGEVAGRRVHVRRPDERAGRIEPRVGAGHAERTEQPVVGGTRSIAVSRSPPAGVTASPTMRRHDVGRPARVVPHRAGLGDQRQRRGVRRPCRPCRRRTASRGSG